jgi:hypothetical protein
MYVVGSADPTDFASSQATASSASSALLAALLGAQTPDPPSVLGALIARELPGVPGARWASITQRRPGGDYVTLVASDDVARRVDAAQYELGDGPCLHALDGEVVCLDDAGLQDRWSELARRVLADTPVRAVLSRPLSAGTTLGSLNVYGERPDAFAAAAMTAVGFLAEDCALALVALTQRVRADNLVLALESSRRIGAAVGVLMAMSHCTYDQAFERIRSTSQRTHRKLREVAEDIILTGALSGN